MNDAYSGAVRIAFGWRDGKLQPPSVVVRRMPAARLFRGRDPAEVAALVPRLFSLCGQAQSAVAQAALAAAGGRGRPLVPSAALTREAIGEHLWRLLIDWPSCLGQGDPRRLQKKPDNATFADYYRRLRGKESAVSLAADLGAWFATQSPLDTVSELAAWDVRVEPATPALLPALNESLARELFAAADESFAAAPLWRGAATEVGALSSHVNDPPVAALLAAGRPLAARYLARWQALGVAIERLADGRKVGVGCLGIAPGIACAWVETARGPLCHRVELTDGRVADYQVIAPTEWNFHPHSVWLGQLGGARAETPEIAENLVRLWALALDPCVPIQLSLSEEN